MVSAVASAGQPRLRGSRGVPALMAPDDGSIGRRRGTQQGVADSRVPLQTQTKEANSSSPQNRLARGLGTMPAPALAPARAICGPSRRDCCLLYQSLPFSRLERT